MEGMEIKETISTRIQLNGMAPNFEAQTTHGMVNFHDWKRDKWAILFSHPADFTPVCTTEFVEFAKRSKSLAQKNVLLMGNSIDSVYAHIGWVRDIKRNFDVEIDFPIIADLDQRVARLYNMVHEPSAATAAVRCVFFIDPANFLRAMIYYPLNVGRNFQEIERVVDALQTVDQHGVACPADWRPGDDVVVPPPVTTDGAAARLADESLEPKEWYFAKRRL